jgi:hypothetical protein
LKLEKVSNSLKLFVLDKNGKHKKRNIWVFYCNYHK